MSTNKKYFYVYYSYEHWERGYIGKRECWCLPIALKKSQQSGGN
jgi:hypothetical protein